VSAVLLQKAPSAAARLVKLPLVRSACSKLSVVYNDTKCSHPNLRTMCEVLENSVTALGTAACEKASPVIVKLEPQISSANDVACKSLDWLETTFPMLHTPTEQVTFPFLFKILISSTNCTVFWFISGFCLRHSGCCHGQEQDARDPGCGEHCS
uniref:Uncharacterized protein n=1 Tax=Seriola dumerili TaxID=41447 RepID=A0A3B4T964_SERDU